MRLVRSAAFKADEIDCLEWSLERFGEKAAERYLNLIRVALGEICREPLIPGSRDFEGVRLFDLRHSRMRAAVDGVVVGNPRHFIVYRVRGERTEALRLLHDSIDLPEHLVD